MANTFNPVSPRVYMGAFVEDIDKMNRTYSQPVHELPTLPVDWQVRLKNFGGKILQDEVHEYKDILDLPDTVLEADKLDVLTAIADWLGDTIVYCTSELRKYGIPPGAILQIIMSSNFSKLGEDGKPILDSTGQKFMKGPNYWKPEPMIRELLAELRKLPEGEV